MDASEAMTVLRNRRILSVFAAVSYPRSTVISMIFPKRVTIMSLSPWLRFTCLVKSYCDAQLEHSIFTLHRSSVKQDGVAALLCVFHLDRLSGAEAGAAGES